MQLPYPFPLKSLEQLISVKIIAGTHDTITGINEIHKVVKGDLSFVDHPKYYQKCLTSAASVVLINSETVDNPQGKTLLVSDDPFRDYNILVRHFRPFIPITTQISPSAKIGKNTIVQAGVVIGEDVVIGENCIIHPNVSIYNYTQIGDNVEIHANTVIGADAFYFKRRPEGYDKMLSCGRVVIEDNVEIGALCTIDKGVSGDTIIGRGTKLDNQVHIGHGCVIGKSCLFAAQVGIAGKTHIKDNVTLWGQVGVSKDLTIGENAVVLAQSGVPKSLEGNRTYFGSPVGDARHKMREIAATKQLPSLLKELRKGDKI